MKRRTLVALITRVPPELAALIKLHAKAQARSVGQTIRMVLEQHFHGKDAKP